MNMHICFLFKATASAASPFFSKWLAASSMRCCGFPVASVFFNFIFLCSAMFEVYEASTLPAETLPPKQEIQGGALAIFFLSFGVRASTHTLPEKTFLFVN